MNALLIVLSIVFYCLFVAGVRRGASSRVNRYLAGTSGLILIFATGFFWVSNAFTGKGIDESVIFHLRYGFEGAGFMEYKGMFVLSISFILLSISAFFIAFRVTAPDKGRPWVKKPVWLYLVLILAFSFHPAAHNLSQLVVSQVRAENPSLSFSSYYKKPDYVNRVKANKNLVYIYAESLERAYFNEDIFPGLITRLKTLEKKGASFTQIHQVNHGAWTVAGMVCSQCGIPLFTPSDGNSMSGMDKFLNGAVCIGDVLSAEGYQLIYMGGASLEFAGKGKLFETHGFKEVLGKEQLLSTLTDKTYQNGWGLYDDTLFDAVYERFAALSERGEKFGLFTLTLDTHHPEGHTSARCADIPYEDGGNSILNAVRCSDRLIGEFVEKIMASPYFKNTLIVVASDHLAMNNTAIGRIMKHGVRTNFLLVIDSDQDQPRVIDRKGSLLDIGPTVLTLLGYETPALGLGRNLMDESEPTLMMQTEDINQTLMGWFPDISALWEYPKIGAGILIDAVRKQVRLEERVMNMPLLLTLTETGQIKGIFFEFFSHRKLRSYVMEMKPDEIILWVDSAKTLSFLDETAEDAPFGVFLGKVGSSAPYTALISDECYISREEFEKHLGGVASPEVADALKQKIMKPLHGEYELAPFDWGNAVGRIVIHSQSTPQGDSYLESDHSRLNLKRGVALVGITCQSEPVLLSHVDPCENITLPSMTEPFLQTIKRFGKEYSLYAIVVHDSIICDAANFSYLFKGLPLEKGPALQLREPYVAIVSQIGEKVFEESGETEGSIHLVLSKLCLIEGPSLKK